MIFKKGDYWKACFNEESDNYAAEYGGGQDYHINKPRQTSIYEC